ncbi:hypothetical protein, partial [Streptomyces sp. SID11385]|uniref:hypothetical protein n=1 Tax=Streptomyces sp. SID11385 TaxID=2706031 RepID=UPI0013C998A8
LTTRHGPVLARLTEAAARFAASSPRAALDLLASAATVANYAGRSDGMPELPQDGERGPRYAWTRVVTDPHTDRPAAVAHLNSL